MDSMREHYEYTVRISNDLEQTIFVSKCFHEELLIIASMMDVCRKLNLGDIWVSWNAYLYVEKYSIKCSEERQEEKIKLDPGECHRF